MSDALVIVAALAVIAAWLAGLTVLDVFTPDDVRAWRRLATLRGFARTHNRVTEAALRSQTLQRLQQSLDLERLLAGAQRSQTPAGFLARSAAMTLLAFAALLGADTAGRAAAGAWPLDPWVILACALLLMPLSVLELRRAARRTREHQADTIADMMTMLAVMTDVRGFQLDDAVRILARSSVDTDLARLLDGGFRRLVPGRHRSTIERYRAVAEAYQLPALRLLADAATAANAGLAEREVYSNVAVAMYQERLAGARQRAARARVLVTLPVAAMLLPLLILIGAPTLAAISGGL